MKQYKVNTLGCFLARIYSVLFWDEFHYPQPIKGRYDVTGSLKEKLKWVYKIWIKQLEVAEKGSGIEAYFAAQDLRFSPPEGFEREAALSLSAGGDLMAVDVLTEANTPNLFDDIRDFYFGADITCANLESTVYTAAPLGRNSIPNMPAKMNTSEGMLDRFLAGGAGIDYFSTANNHSYDYGEAGLLATLDILEQKGCWFSGTNRTPEQQEDVLIVEKNGIKTAFLAYTFDMNGNQYEKKHLINEVRFNDETVDISLVRRHIQRAKEKGADLIVASCHWGWEFEMYPHKNIMEVAHLLAEEGVDVILGGHPHVAQPMERYTAKGDGRQCLIIYSLGDFVSYHPLTPNSKLTYVVRFQVEKGTLRGTGHTCITQLEVLPVYIAAGEKADGTCDFRLLQFEKVLMSPGHYALTEGERRDLPRLDQALLRGIILPRGWEHR